MRAAAIKVRAAEMAETEAHERADQSRAFPAERLTLCRTVTAAATHCCHSLGGWSSAIHRTEDW